MGSSLRVWIPIPVDSDEEQTTLPTTEPPPKIVQKNHRTSSAQRTNASLACVDVGRRILSRWFFHSYFDMCFSYFRFHKIVLGTVRKLRNALGSDCPFNVKTNSKGGPTLGYEALQGVGKGTKWPILPLRDLRMIPFFLRIRNNASDIFFRRPSTLIAGF